MRPTTASTRCDHGSTRRSSGGNLSASRPSGRRHGRASGFTLLETIVAITILGIGVLGVAGSLVTSMKTTRESRARTDASYLAEQQMEIFRLMSTANLTLAQANPPDPGNPSSEIDPDPNDGNPTTFTRTWEILSDDPEPGIFKVTVIVGFTDKLGNPQTERIQSLKADI